jgi:Virulence factor
MAKATVVYWRDIPAQVIVKAGRSNAKRVLPERFEKAIDRAAMHAKLRDTDSYLEQWRRGEPVDCGDDLEAEAERMAREIDDTYTDDVLSAYVLAGGMKPDL